MEIKNEWLDEFEVGLTKLLKAYADNWRKTLLKEVKQEIERAVVEFHMREERR